MKQLHITFLLTMLMSMIGIEATAHDIAVTNSDGVTIYYNWTNNNTELYVTYRGESYDSYSNEYQGSVVIPEIVTYNGIKYSVTSIGEQAFEDCSSLTNVNIPNSVTTIGMLAFSGCSSLTRISIPSSITSIGMCAFEETGLYINTPNGVFYVDKWVCGYKGTVPSSISILEGTIGIAGSSFASCFDLKRLVIPHSVTTIGNSAFLMCSNLESLTIKDSENTPSKMNIESFAFLLCSKLSEVSIGNSVTSIGEFAFGYCFGLTSLTIPNSVTSIGQSAFYNCTGLTSVILSNSATRIGELAFKGCFGLTSLTIPNSVTSIGDYAFAGCSGLKFFTIGTSLKYIGAESFSDCSGVTQIISHATTPPVCGRKALDDINKSTCTLSVPSGTIKAYQAAEQWKEFFFINDDISDVKSANAVQPQTSSVFDLNGRKQKTMLRGINIIKMSDGTTKKVIKQ